MKKKPVVNSSDNKSKRKHTVSRRNFLKLSVAAAAGAGIDIKTAVADELPPLLPVPEKPGFDHLVVLMFENRSFDKFLGHLYLSDKLPEGQTFNGIANGNYSNPSPNGPVAAHVYDGSTDIIMRSPSPDPGEEFPHVNTQLFGIVDPPGNEYVEFNKMTTPFNAPSSGATAKMDGFVKDYINNFVATQGRQPTREEYEVIMGSFSPEMLPVTSISQEFCRV